jgi:hypothetical protein
MKDVIDKTGGVMGEFREIIIPGDILDDDNISDAAKILYGKIARLAYKEGYCWASNKFLDGTESGSTARHNIKALEKYGYIKCVYDDFGKNRKIYISDIDSRVKKTRDPLTANGQAPRPQTDTPRPQTDRPPVRKRTQNILI